MTEVDKLFVNGHVFNVFLRKFQDVNVAVRDGQVYWLTQERVPATEVIDLDGQYLVPGLIDIHMHIESSMTTPGAFGAQAAQFGTTTVVADDHEIANVAGIEGLNEFMNQASPIDMYYAIPSSVPSTLPELETTGGVIDVAAVKQLLRNPRVIALGEAMNFQGLTSDDDSLIKQLVAVCRQERPTMPLEGHCPKYTGVDLARFIGSGITSDHTQQTPAGMLERISNGMFIELQAKSMKRDVIDTIIDQNLFEHCAIVTDDVMADDLRTGHLNVLVQKAIELGMAPADAIYLATFTPARRMGLWDRGAIAPGRVADFVVLSDLNQLTISAVYKNGERVHSEVVVPATFSDKLYHSVQAAKLAQGDFVLRAPQTNGMVTVNVMQLNHDSTFTACRQEQLPVVDHVVQWQDAGLALLCVQERYGHNAPLQFALVAGAINRPGAVASTWAHDHHNMLIMGTDLDAMTIAQNQLIEEQGGYLVSSPTEIVANVPLPIGGIISHAPVSELGAQLAAVRTAMQALGYHHFNEIMSFATLSLLVSQALKISDKGMIDVQSQQPVPLFVQ